MEPTTEKADLQCVTLTALPWRIDTTTGSRYWSVALSQAQLTYFEVPPDARFKRHAHTSEQITMVLEGLLIFELGEVTYSIGAGEVIAIPGDLPHSVSAGPNGARAVDAWSPPQAIYGPGHT
jgi:quercetin dioxygenase-like cupin family protein